MTTGSYVALVISLGARDWRHKAETGELESPQAHSTPDTFPHEIEDGFGLVKRGFCSR